MFYAGGFVSSLRSRRMKNIGRARHARERDTRGEKSACPRGPPKSFPAPYHQIARVKEICTRERNLYMIAKAQPVCQLNAFCRAAIDAVLLFYMFQALHSGDSLIASIACLFVEKLIFESFV